MSFSENMVKDPIDDAASPAKWLWKMHNKVNAKLRAQHVGHQTDDPSFKAVEEVYKERLASGCSRTAFEGWEFLFSVAEAHPLSRQMRSSVPIQGHPPVETIVDPLERNRWNVMEPEERLVYYTQFWKLLPTVLPFPEWTAHWKQASSLNDALCRKDCLKSLWGIRRHMETKLELLNSTTYNSLCKELQRYKSGCAKSVRGKTCRKKKSTK